MKKPVLTLTALITTLSMIVSIAAVGTEQEEQQFKSPYSNGGIIGDNTETGYITGYYSNLTVFGMNENGFKLAIGLNANYSSITIADAYSYSSFRCGNTDDTGFFDEAIPIGVFDNNDYAIYLIHEDELQFTPIVNDFAVGDRLKIYAESRTYGTYGKRGELHMGEITSVDGGTVKYYSDYGYDPDTHTEHDALAAVYTENEELVGFIITEDEIMTVSQVEELMNSEHFVPLEYEEPKRYEASKQYDTPDETNIIEAPFNYAYFIPRTVYRALGFVLPAVYVQLLPIENVLTVLRSLQFRKLEAEYDKMY